MNIGNDLSNIFSKYEDSVLSNIDEDNMLKIAKFLRKEGVNYLEDIIENYLDLFTIPFDEFKDKYERLNNKYQKDLPKLINDDVNILEEMLNI